MLYPRMHKFRQEVIIDRMALMCNHTIEPIQMVIDITITVLRVDTPVLGMDQAAEAEGNLMDSDAQVLLR